jgi:biotin transport system substrate-specific component
MSTELGPPAVDTAPAVPRSVQVARRPVFILGGALLVSLAAQFTVPVPLSPVPMTLQPLAVLVVGGIFGAWEGVSALILYLVLGALGLPVFAGGGSGPIHFLGPTGGYLLAFPVAAGVTGGLASPHPRSILRVLLACAAGMALIHIGGVAQLALLGRDPALALRVGFVPFLTGDLLKVGLAAAVVLAVGPTFRSSR